MRAIRVYTAVQLVWVPLCEGGAEGVQGEVIHLMLILFSPLNTWND